MRIAQGSPLLEDLYLGQISEFQEDAAKALSQCKNLSIVKFPRSNLDGMAVNLLLKVQVKLAVTNM